jgi:peroxiredoxin Q/BCP
MPLIEVGKKAPAFTLKDQAGKTHKLSEYAGRPVILYFYPKDDTPGCTAEACSFRDHEPDHTKEHAVVLGVSADPLESHEKFRGKYELNFPLLSDQTADVAKMYGVWKEKNMYGHR